ncbi:hypothetical protein MKW98_010317, partial [Papaver atlanticum]
KILTQCYRNYLFELKFQLKIGDASKFGRILRSAGTLLMAGPSRRNSVKIFSGEQLELV